MIPHQRRIPLYHQLADVLREHIRRRTYLPGTPMPTERELCKAHGVGLMTVRRAMAMLREEGLVSTSRGQYTFVRDRADRTRVVLPTGSRLVCRMPSAPERDRLRIEPGVPLIEIHHANGSLQILLADRTEVVASPAQA